MTPEYQEGTYAYFATVDDCWNLAYPYVVDPNFYEHYQNRSVSNVNEETTVYTTSTAGINEIEGFNINIFPNPATDLIAIQIAGMISADLKVELIDISGKVIKTAAISPGSTIAYFDVQTIYMGTYMVRISDKASSFFNQIVISIN